MICCSNGHDFAVTDAAMMPFNRFLLYCLNIIHAVAYPYAQICYGFHARKFSRLVAMTFWYFHLQAFVSRHFLVEGLFVLYKG